MLYTLKHTVPIAVLPVAYCITMWCILRTPPRSTRHSAVEPPSDSAHCPPDSSKLFLYSPSTALSAPALGNQVPLCHAGLSNARFSVEHQIMNFNKHNSSRMGFLQKSRRRYTAKILPTINLQNSQADQESEKSPLPLPHLRCI